MSDFDELHSYIEDVQSEIKSARIEAHDELLRYRAKNLGKQSRCDECGKVGNIGNELEPVVIFLDPLAGEYEIFIFCRKDCSTEWRD